LTGLLYDTFLFLLRLPKYDWLFIYSVTRVKKNVAERKRREVQAVPAKTLPMWLKTPELE